MASRAAAWARKTSRSPSGVRSLTKIFGCGVPNTAAFSAAAYFMFSIIFWKFMPTCTLPSADLPALAAALAACSAIKRNRLEIAASCRPMLASLMVQM